VHSVPGNRRTALVAALYGPTSSGKTSLSVQVAQRIQRELGREVVIISADSRQVYRYMDIGTSKTTAAEMHGIAHTLLDVIEPTRKLELEEYVSLAREEISKADAAGALPFIVGGTGVYVSAVMEGWEVDSVGASRASLRRDFPPSMAADAYAMLRRLDRGAADRVHPNNYEAVINALAARVAGQDTRRKKGPSRALVLGLDPGQRAVEQRVERTYDDQVRKGLFDEIMALNDRYGLDEEFRAHGRDSRNQVLHTHGYREYFEVALRHGKPVAALSPAALDEVRTEVLDRIRPHTRRQRSWFAKLGTQRMVTTPDQAFSEIARHLSAHP
jgi:tRNA dimethylallyltransferase